MQDVLHLPLGNRSGIVRRAADESSDLRRALHQMPRVLAHFHLDENVSREELAFADVLLTALHLDHFLDRYQDLAEMILHALFESGIGVSHVPLLAHHSPCPISRLTTHSRLASTTQRNSAIVMTKPKTTTVVCRVSLRVGQTTFRVSATE